MSIGLRLQFYVRWYTYSIWLRSVHSILPVSCLKSLRSGLLNEWDVVKLAAFRLPANTSGGDSGLLDRDYDNYMVLPSNILRVSTIAHSIIVYVTSYDLLRVTGHVNVSQTNYNSWYCSVICNVDSNFQLTCLTAHIN